MRAEERVYRLLTAKQWSIAKHRQLVPRTSIDIDFIHLSLQEQILVTAELYFGNEKNPIVLEIDRGLLGDSLRLEAVEHRGGILFPHLYSDRILWSWICGVHMLEKGKNGGFQWGKSLHY